MIGEAKADEDCSDERSVQPNSISWTTRRYDSEAVCGTGGHCAMWDLSPFCTHTRAYRQRVRADAAH